MSRSKKKSQFYDMVKPDTYYKKIYNKKIRKQNKNIDEDENIIIPNGKSYKKVNESWNIHDCRTYVSYRDLDNWGIPEEEKIEYWKKLLSK